MKFQKLNDVCNGGHIHELDEDFYSPPPTRKQLGRTLGKETKAILVVGSDQTRIKRVLRSLSRNKIGLRAKRLCQWSPTASLWIVRK